MKKLQIRKRRAKEAPSRITNETVAEHRERILAGGRRFKYPVQYARHRLVFNTVIISVAALLLVVLFGWWQLYPAQNTSDFFYRVTRVLPLPVASVDGASVQYSDYLMNYRSSVHYLQQKEQADLSSEDGKRQIDYLKNQSMSDAVADAYAAKLAKEKNVSVSDKQVQDFIASQRTVSEDTYDAVILDYYGWSPGEYRHAMSKKLLRQEVSYAIDDKAQQSLQKVEALLNSGNKDFAQIAAQVGGQGQTAVTTAAPGNVPRTNQDGGLSLAAIKLKPGEVSGVVKSAAGDGYYFVKLISSDANQVNYEFIRVPLTVFRDKLAAIKKDNKVQYYISVPEVTTQIKK